VADARLIGVITVRGGIAVQSFSYERYLPIGKPEFLAENLDRWGVDEILVKVVDRSKKEMGPDIDLLRRLASLDLQTPLIYGGGIRDAQDAATVIQNGADRVLIDSILTEKSYELEAIRDCIGKQAVIGAVPVLFSDGVKWFEYKSRTIHDIVSANMVEKLSHYLSELLVIDFKNEGLHNSFNIKLIEKFPSDLLPLLVFGGITEIEQKKELLRTGMVSGLCVGNSLNYREHAVQHIKRHFSQTLIRAPYFIETKENKYG
jgi:cyclase